MVLPVQLPIELTYFWCIWFMIYIILSLFVNMDLRDLPLVVTTAVVKLLSSVSL